MLYCSLSDPYFYYPFKVWASTYKINLRRLVILQKSIITTLHQTSCYMSFIGPNSIAP